MPPISDRLKVNYPENGWSSWYGAYYGNEYPAAVPYGIVIRAPGSTGLFKPFNNRNGIKYPINAINSALSVTYTSTFQPPIATIASFINLSLDGPNSTSIFINWYFEVGPPPFFYASALNRSWPGMRSELLIPGPGPAPLPMLARIGPIVSITPWNRRGWELLP